jgi:hypothetical protein
MAESAFSTATLWIVVRQPDADLWCSPLTKELLLISPLQRFFSRWLSGWGGNI